MTQRTFSTHRALAAVFAAVLAAGAAAGQEAAVPADVPFRLQIEAHPVAGLPGLHSVAHGVHDGVLVLLGGRTNGLHGFAPSRAAAKAPSFPRSRANDTVYAVDLAAQRLVGQAKVDGLPKAVADQLKASNTQSVTRGGWLYVAGGYGSTLDDKSLVTLQQVIAVDLAALVERLAAGGPLDLAFARDHMYVGEQPALAVTGGDLEVLDGRFVLVFGQRFDGEYTPGGGLVRQEYSESVRVFDFDMTSDTDDDGVRRLAVTYRGKVPSTDLGQDPEGPYHRRDLPVRPALDPSGNVRIAAYGGVFKGGRMEGYVHPVYVVPTNEDPGIALHLDEDTEQLMSHYECAAVSSYSARTGAMYVTFYGGISQYYWDPASGGLKRDAVNMVKDPPRDGLPFINTVSTLRTGGPGSGQFLHVGERLPPEPVYCGAKAAPYLGAETLFVLDAGVPATDGVILLDEIAEPVTAGYLLGGIASTGPYPVDGVTCASPAVYRVRLVPGRTTDTIELELPQE